MGRKRQVLFEKIIYQDGYSFGERTFRFDSIYKTWHYHPEYELMYIREGEGNFFIDNAVYPFKKGDLYFIGANIPHIFACDMEYNKAQGYTYIRQVVQFTEKILPQDFTEQREFSNIVKLLDRGRFGLDFTASRSAKQVVELLDMIPESNSIRKIWDVYKMLDILGQEQDYEQLLAYDCNELGNHKDDVVNKVYLYLKANMHNEIRLNDIAEFVNYCPNTLCNYFKKSTGKTIFNYLNEIRIQHSWKLLAHTDKNIVEIAYESGYNSISHFNEQFVKYSGVTPTDYRVSHQKSMELKSL